MAPHVHVHLHANAMCQSSIGAASDSTPSTRSYLAHGRGYELAESYSQSTGSKAR